MTSSQVGTGSRGLRPLPFEPRLQFLVRQLRPFRVAVDDRLARGQQARQLRLRRQDRRRLERARRELDLDGGQGAAGLDREVEPEHDAVLEVAVGPEEDHRRDRLVAEPLAEPDEQLVGDRRRGERMQPGELERLAVGFGPATGVAGQRSYRGVVPPGPPQVGQGIGLGVVTAVGAGDDPAHLGSQRRVDRAPGPLREVEFEHRRGGAGQPGCHGLRPVRERLPPA